MSSTIQDIKDAGILVALAAGAYLIWKTVFQVEEKTCPPGYEPVNPCEGQIGWVGTLCNMGRNITGAFLDCKPISDPDISRCNALDKFDCIWKGNTWQDADCSCTQGTQPPKPGCTNGQTICQPATGTIEGCIDGQWVDTGYPCEARQDTCEEGTTKCEAGFLQECLRIAGFTKWQAVIENGDVKHCEQPGCPNAWEADYCPNSGGYWDEDLCSCVYPNKPIEPTCSANECVPGTVECQAGISHRCVPQGTGCEQFGIWAHGGHACDPVTNIVDCECGKIDLNNPPGTTCESACAGAPKGDPDWRSCLTKNFGYRCGAIGIWSEQSCHAVCGNDATWLPTGQCASPGQIEYAKCMGLM